jgi:RNA-directed DNA polymerase
LGPNRKLSIKTPWETDNGNFRISSPSGHINRCGQTWPYQSTALGWKGHYQVGTTLETLKETKYMTSHDDSSFPEVSEDLEVDSYEPGWHDVNWAQVNSDVRRFRERIFTRSKAGNWKQVRSLQKLFLKNKSNILHSIRKVLANKGRQTAGVDDVANLTPHQKLELFDDLCQLNLRDWSPPPVRRIYFPKPDGRWRPIGIPTIKDRVIQAMVVNILEPEWEAKFENVSYGFRPGRSVADAVQALFVPLSSKTGKEWIVDCDIKGCYDNISHPFVLETLGDFPAKYLVERWLKAGFLEFGVYVESELGFPQGGPISPLLCNISLHGLQKDLDIRLRANGLHRSDLGSGRIYIRYADDFVILCKSHEDAVEAIKITKKFLADRGLELKKENIVHISEGFDFVGFNIRWTPKYGIIRDRVVRIDRTSITPVVTFWDRDSGLILAKPVDKSVTKVKETLKSIFVDTRGKSAAVLIKRANAVIRGWAESKIHGTSSRTFKELDNYLYTLQMNWIKRKHSAKSARWRVARYFRSPNVKRYAGYKWVFHAPGTPAYMLYFSWFKPYDHLKVISINCVDDPALREYWLDLKFRRHEARPVNEIVRKSHAELMHSQYWICPVCSEPLTNGEELHTHHIKGRRFKNADAFSNLLILHTECHKLVHAQKGQNQEWEMKLTEYKVRHPRITRY